jgi:hypothetical protein
MLNIYVRQAPDAAPQDPDPLAAAGATVLESRGSHAINVSRTAPVVALIEQAARALETASR